MSDEVFHDVAYKARKREHLLAGIDEFLDAVTVLPPGEWDPSIRIEPPQQVPSQVILGTPTLFKRKAFKGCDVTKNAICTALSCADRFRRAASIPNPTTKNMWTKKRKSESCARRPASCVPGGSAAASSMTSKGKLPGTGVTSRTELLCSPWLPTFSFTLHV